MKPVLQAPGTTRLKLLYDEVLSSFGFNLNVRLYSAVAASTKRLMGEKDLFLVGPGGYRGVRCPLYRGQVPTV